VLSYQIKQGFGAWCRAGCCVKCKGLVLCGC